MCIAVPCKIIAIHELTATIDAQGARSQANLTLMPGKVNIGDYVLVHAGFAIQKIEPETGLEILKIFEEILNTHAPEPDNA